MLRRGEFAWFVGLELVADANEPVAKAIGRREAVVPSGKFRGGQRSQR